MPLYVIDMQTALMWRQYEIVRQLDIGSYASNVQAYILSYDQLRHGRTAKIAFQSAARVQYRG